MQSLSHLGIPEKIIDFVKAELARPFYYLEFGQYNQPVDRTYSTLNYSDGWYEGEVDQAG